MSSHSSESDNTARQKGRFSYIRFQFLSFANQPKWDRQFERQRLEAHGGTYISGNRARGSSADVFVVNSPGGMRLDISKVANPAQGADLGTLEGLVAQYGRGVDVATGWVVPALDQSKFIRTRGHYEALMSGESCPSELEIFYEFDNRDLVSACSSDAASTPSTITPLAPAAITPAQSAVSVLSTTDQPQSDKYGDMRRVMLGEGFTMLLDGGVGEDIRQSIEAARLPTTDIFGPGTIYIFPTVRAENGELVVPHASRMHVARLTWLAGERGGHSCSDDWLRACLEHGVFFPVHLGAMD